MYLSRIELNRENARARRDLGDPYEMHSTLSRALAEPGRPDAVPTSFLWRSEPFRVGEMAVVLLQSVVAPNWSAIEARSPGWASTARTRPLDLAAIAPVGVPLRFRLRANPTVTRAGKRHALVREVEQNDWLGRQGERFGFQVGASWVGDSSRIVTRKRGASGAPVVVHAVTWDGMLTVTDAKRFSDGVQSGLGHAKFLGLGLLSVAPSSG
jgi:CRISPR system Cascade subunit CasE